MYNKFLNCNSYWCGVPPPPNNTEVGSVKILCMNNCSRFLNGPLLGTCSRDSSRDTNWKTLGYQISLSPPKTVKDYIGFINTKSVCDCTCKTEAWTRQWIKSIHMILLFLKGHNWWPSLNGKKRKRKNMGTSPKNKSSAAKLHHETVIWNDRVSKKDQHIAFLILL